MSRAAPLAERDFQGLVTDTALALGWLVYHPHDSRRSAAGFPDLVLVRERVIFAKLKTRTGRLATAQAAWLAALTEAAAEAYVWRPDDWDAIEAALRRRGPDAGAPRRTGRIAPSASTSP